MIAQFREFLHFLSIPFLHLNFIDILIVIAVLVYMIEGYALGFLRATMDFISFLFSFIFALAFYDLFGAFLISTIKIPAGFANALGFFIAAFVFQIFATIFFRFILIPFVSQRFKNILIPDNLEKIAGIIPGFLSALVLLSFILTMVVALPLSPFLKNSVSASKLGEPLVSNIQGFDKTINNVFGGAVNDALTFLTVEPKSEELLKLNFKTDEFVTDPSGEKEMFDLLNIERENAGLNTLEVNELLIETARDHCEDMFRRGYFSHYTPEGLSPFDRMEEDNIAFKFAGENLALAPNAKLAMNGLMNSPGHKANILSKNFGEVGIGVIDGGIYGEMFCQEFKD